jgi:cell division protein FtsB
VDDIGAARKQLTAGKGMPHEAARNFKRKIDTDEIPIALSRSHNKS